MLFANSLAAVIAAPYQQTTALGWLLQTKFGAFDMLAWGVAFWRMTKASDRPAKTWDVIFLLSVCLFGTLRQQVAAPLAITALAFRQLFSGDDELRASAAILFAIASHQLWSPLTFNLFSPEFIQFDTVLVGRLVTLTVKGATWQNNIIAAPNGHSIAILEGCSSFANVSACLLAWVSLAKLERTRWVRDDMWVALIAILAQVSLNTGRIYMLAQSSELFTYWHDGAGAQIYDVVGSALAVFIGVIGTRWAARRS